MNIKIALHSFIKSFLYIMDGRVFYMAGKTQC